MAIVAVKSDLLEAVIKYAIEQHSMSDINPFDFGDNEEKIGYYDVLTADNDEIAQAQVDVDVALQELLDAVTFAKGDEHVRLMLVPLPKHYCLPTAFNFKEPTS